MRITHSLHGKVQEKEGENGFLLTDHRGDFFLWPARGQETGYGGYFIFDQHAWDYTKCLSLVRCEGREATALNITPGRAELSFGPSAQRYTLAEGGLVIDIDHEGTSTVEADIRGIHEFDDQGRVYRVRRDDRFLIVEYTKYRDGTLKDVAWKGFLVLLGAENAKIVGSWQKREYPYDAERHARSDWYVYDAATITGPARLIACFSKNLVQAQVKALQLEKHADELIGKSQGSGTTVVEHAARHAFESLTMGFPHQKGIFAGLPWFYHFWTRDELISSIGYLYLQRPDAMKGILWKYVGAIQQDGRLPNRFPHAELGCADGTGWLFKRIRDLLSFLQRHHLGMVSKEDFSLVFDKIYSTIGFVNRHYGKEFLVLNGPKETWMDTDAGGDARDGARIEIQALHLTMLSFGKEIGKSLSDPRGKELAQLERSTRDAVRKRFFDGERLADGWKDGASDWTQRPNVFIAAYVYPDLLSEREWRTALNYALQMLWLPWGGLASIETGHPLYCSDYTGMDNKSYHRGDSWFFLNNMAAVAMHRIDKGFFREHVEKILAASTEELLFSGLAGHHAEVSSASRLSSKGCLAQAWSAALLLELLDETGR